MQPHDNLIILFQWIVVDQVVIYRSLKKNLFNP